MSDLESFRAQTREWLEANCPAEMRAPVRDEGDVYWGGRNAHLQERCAKGMVRGVPRQGLHRSRMADRIWRRGPLAGAKARCCARKWPASTRARRCPAFGIWMLGPALLHFGTEGQKKRFLNEIAHGEIRWCQGYSEPGSGSDLVSMQTYGEDKGDHWIVNGQKVWTSYADEADWIFCLVRTDKENKYQGITFMLFDMAGEGVSTKPIKLISAATARSAKPSWTM